VIAFTSPPFSVIISKHMPSCQKTSNKKLKQNNCPKNQQIFSLQINTAKDYGGMLFTVNK
jgi:hypothetical protein